MVHILFGSNTMWGAISNFSPPEKALYYHSCEVYSNSLAIAIEMGCDSFQIKLIKHAAFWHDVGKFAYPELFFGHQGAFTPEQEARKGAHSYASASIIQKYWNKTVRDWGMARLVAIIVAGHHWRYCDSEAEYNRKISTPQFRYPEENVPEVDGFLLTGSRIIKVADYFTAATEVRLDGRRIRPLTEEEALHEIMRGANAEFDPLVVEALANVVYKTRTKGQVLVAN